MLLLIVLPQLRVEAAKAALRADAATQYFYSFLS